MCLADADVLHCSKVIFEVKAQQWASERHLKMLVLSLFLYNALQVVADDREAKIRVSRTTTLVAELIHKKELLSIGRIVGSPKAETKSKQTPILKKIPWAGRAQTF